MTSPAVSVIMPVYNAELYLKEAVDSILSQSFADFELFIIDDASTDKSIEILNSFNDHRITLIRKSVNTGYTDSLNMAIPLTKGKYIARMDADDVSLENRFQVQFNYMEAHQDVLVLGTMYKIIDKETVRHYMPIDHDEVKLFALMKTPVAHPTVFIRRSVFDQYNLRYDRAFEPAEDYDLWSRILEYGKIENLPDVLLYYRVHTQQTSAYRSKKQLEMANRIRSRQLERLMALSSDMYDSVFVIKTLSYQLLNITSEDLVKVDALLKDLVAANKDKKIYNDLLFAKFLNEIWWHHVLKLKKYKLKYLIPLLKSPLNSKSVNLLFRLKFIIKSFLGWEAKQRNDF